MSVTKRYIIFDNLEQEESRDILDANHIQVSITLDTDNIDAQLESDVMVWTQPL